MWPSVGDASACNRVDELVPSGEAKKVFCRKTFVETIAALQGLPDHFLLSNSTTEQLLHGLTWLRNENVSAVDEDIAYSDPLKNYKIQQVYLRKYAHLAEYVYFGVIGALVEISPRARSLGKNMPHSELDSRWKQAKTHVGRHVSDVYRTDFRNSIVHGGVSFDRDGVVFVDRKNVRNKLAHEDCISLGEKLLDVCNGASLAFAVFASARAGKLPNVIGEWAREERLMSRVSTPFLHPVSIRTESIGTEKRQHILICDHCHWHEDILLFDLARALIMMKSELSEVERCFVSAKDARGMPSFVAADCNEIPSLAGLGDTEFGAFFRACS